MAGDITTTTRVIVTARAMGRCEWCGRPAALQLHHRLFRSRGGSHGPENLVALCGSGNHTGCHGRAHGAGPGDLEAAIAAGMTIPRGGDPRSVSIVSVIFRLPVWLLEDGDYEFDAPAGDPSAVPRMTATRRPPGR
jgi:HNH endonuclease